MAASKRKLAIVTGGASGIGMAIAEKFIENGITTVIIGRNEQKLECAKKKLGELCIPIAFDLSDIDSIHTIIKDITGKYGPVEILVNNAGINMKKEFVEVTNDEFQKIILTNLTAVFAVSREVVKSMLEEGGGSIINISSMASQYGIPKVVAYSASKSAIEGMTRSMAVDLSPKGIRVNCIAPGFIATDMSAAAMKSDPERKQKVLSRTPMGAFGMPADVADAALFLATDASRYITGIIMPVDGGNSIGF